MKTDLITDQAQMAAFMATVPDHVFFKDRELRFISVSLSLARHYGCSIENVIGKTSFDFYPEDQARVIWEDQMRVMNTGEPRIDQIVCDEWPDGRVTWFLCNIMPLRSADGEILGIYGTDKDITAAKQMEQALDKANRELQGLCRTAGMAEIANNVLHNVGNVLNSVNVSASLIGQTVHNSKVQALVKALQLLDEHAADVGTFLSTTDKGKALPGYLNRLATALVQEKTLITTELESLAGGIEHVKEIVTAQQAYAGNTRVLEPAQIQDLVEDALRINRDSLQRHAVTVIREFTAVPALLLDRHLILQVLIHLIRNAKQAMDAVPNTEHRIALRTRIVGSGEGSHLAIEVEDNGTGIAPEHLASLFTHGYTTRRAAHGFGLHSCALAVKEMGGSIAAHSDGPGRGAVFTVKLPVQHIGNLPRRQG